MRSFLFSFFCLSLLTAQAQTIKIVNTKSGLPLEFVNVVGLPSFSVVTTNKNGEANLSFLQKDTALQISALGYERRQIAMKNLPDVKFQIKLTPAFFDIDEIVISATRWEQDSRTIPHKVSSIKSKDFQFQNPQTAADLLATSGEVFIQKSQQGGGSPMIRGFATNRLLYSVDGVRMNTAIFRSGNLQNVISLDPFAMEKVEVLFGPGATLYGSDAIGGVMSFNTKNPILSADTPWRFDGNAAIRTSSANSEISSHLDLSIASKKVGFLSSFSRTDYGDLKMGTNGPSDYLRDSLIVRFENQDIVAKNDNPRLQIPTNYSQTNFMQKILFQPTEKIRLQYGFHLSETTEFDRYDRLTQRRNSRFRYAEWQYGPQKWIMHQLSAQFSSATKLYDQFKINAAFQQFEESRIDRQFQNTDRRTQVEKVNAYSSNVDFTKKLSAVHRLNYGMESVTNQVKSSSSVENITTNATSASQSRYPNSTWFSNAIYATDQYRATEKLTIEAGARLNQFSLDSEFDTSFVSIPFQKIELNNLAITGSMGAVYRPSNMLVFSSNLSTGFRAPNVDDIGKFADQSDGSVIVPNQQLSAEYAYNIDLGGTAILSERLKVDLTLFYTYLNDALVRRDFTFNGSDSLFFDGENRKVEAIQNAANAQVYGAQFGLEAKLNSDFSFAQQLNFQKGEEELENGKTSPSRHAAPLFGISKLSFQKKKFLVELSLLYADKVSFENLNVEEKEKPEIYANDSEGRPYSPSWYTLNLKAQYIISKAITANLGVENLTNQRYRTYSSGIAAAGINFVSSITAKF